MWFLVCALAITWVTGIGRYWDHGSADLWQYAGLGSVAYAFGLASLLWSVGWPLRPKGWSYANVLLFVCMTSPPALLYATPVERVTTREVAMSLNVFFLAVVGTWRIALLLHFMVKRADLGLGVGATAALVPLVVTTFALNAITPDFAIFAAPHDPAYGIVFALSYLALFLSIPLLLTYLMAFEKRRKARRRITSTHML